MHHPTHSMTSLANVPINETASTNPQSTTTIPISSSQETLEWYRRILTLNVISKYDPEIQQLVFKTSHSVIYEFKSETSDWEKLDFQGPLAFYSRNSNNLKLDSLEGQSLVQSDNFPFGIILLNRDSPQNFGLGLIPSKYIKDKKDQMMIEENSELLILKSLEGKTYGLWVFDLNDRKYLNQLIEYYLDN